MLYFLAMLIIVFGVVAGGYAVLVIWDHYHPLENEDDERLRRHP